MSNIGFRIVTDTPRVPDDVVAEFTAARLPTTNLSDVMGRYRTIGGGIAAVSRDDDLYLVGNALTVRTHAADNLMVHKAIEMARPGDVIVIEAGGDMSYALVGEMVCQHARVRGVAGFVIDGPIRDGGPIRAMSFPVYAKGLTPRGPYKEGPGEIGVPISVGGAPVLPGDLIAGDADGVVVVANADVNDVLAAGTKLAEKEQVSLTEIAEGRWDRTWIDETLRAKGCEGV